MRQELCCAQQELKGWAGEQDRVELREKVAAEALSAADAALTAAIACGDQEAIAATASAEGGTSRPALGDNASSVREIYLVGPGIKVVCNVIRNRPQVTDALGCYPWLLHEGVALVHHTAQRTLQLYTTLHTTHSAVI